MDKYEVLVSGSDQVLNPDFTLHGENGLATPVYWLGIGGKRIKRIGYSVSFGCRTYPQAAVAIAKKQVKSFDAISVREQTGLEILEQLNYRGITELIPDPTILLGKTLFDHIGIDYTRPQDDYTCVYMLRHEIKMSGSVRYIDETHHPLSMTLWMRTIVCASRLVTNSYHGMIMAILAHVPFVVVLETGSGSGMNDRFKTLLSIIGEEKRMVLNEKDIANAFQMPYDFKRIDEKLAAYREIGANFLISSLNTK